MFGAIPHITFLFFLISLMSTPAAFSSPSLPPLGITPPITNHNREDPVHFSSPPSFLTLLLSAPTRCTLVVSPVMSLGCLDFRSGGALEVVTLAVTRVSFHARNPFYAGPSVWLAKYTLEQTPSSVDPAQVCVLFAAVASRRRPPTAQRHEWPVPDPFVFPCGLGAPARAVEPFFGFTTPTSGFEK